MILNYFLILSRNNAYIKKIVNILCVGGKIIMKKLISIILLLTVMLSILVGCSTSTASNENKSGHQSTKEKEVLTVVWYPNESGNDLRDARDAIGAVIEGVTSKKVEHKLTTDYAIAIESLANGTADICWMGAQGYVEAHEKNENVVPLVVYTGKSGTLEDAVYYSWLAVRKEDAALYGDNDDYSIENIANKKFSFVSNSSTSGFKIPSAVISSYFGEKSQWNGITPEDLMEGGKEQLFSEVLYGGSHQGSCVNLVTKRTDVAAFCDSSLMNYLDHIGGQHNRPGAIYAIKNGAQEPFDKFNGEEFVLISTTPVLNEPFAVNKETVSKEDIEKIEKALTSDEVANNPKIFVPKGSDINGIFDKKGDERFVVVGDEWFQPIRELSKK